MTISTKLMLLATVAAAGLVPAQGFSQTVTTGPAGSIDSLQSQASRRATIARVNIRVEGTNTFEPALRIVDSNGAVRFVRIGERGLTPTIFFNDSALQQFASQILNFNTRDVIQLEEFKSDPPAAPAAPACTTCFIDGKCVASITGWDGLDEILPFEDDFVDMAGLIIADEDEDQRSALYATL